MENILKRVDYTLLKPTTTWDDVKQLCDEAKVSGVASVCIPPSFIKRANLYLQGAIPICTVIGFPLGYSTTTVKVAETINAISNGASEIDMVINLGDVKAGDFSKVEGEIRQIKLATSGKVLKVIIETCYLTEEEKVELCQIVTRAGATFIKTSTGFGSSGATLEDVALMKANVGENIGIKASGGIRSAEDAKNFIEAGAGRIGTSSLLNAEGVTESNY